MAKAGPTQRTLECCRKLGMMPGVVERYNHHTQRRSDLFGFIDIVAISEDVRGCLAIQCTSGDNIQSRIKKIMGEDCRDAARLWLGCENTIEVWGWKQFVKKNQDGTKAKVPKWDAVRWGITTRSNRVILRSYRLCNASEMMVY